MTSYSIGTDLIREARRTVSVDHLLLDGSGGAPPPEEPKKSAMAAITEAIPAEGLSVYIGTYGIFVSIASEPYKVLTAFATLAVAIAIAIFAMAYPVWGPSKDLPEKNKKLVRRQVVGRAIGISVLLIIYVASVTGNPFEMAFKLPIVFAVGLAIIAAAVIGILAKRPKPAS